MRGFLVLISLPSLAHCIVLVQRAFLSRLARIEYRDVPDPDTGIPYPVKFRHPALSGIRYKFAGYLPDSTVRYFVTTMKWKSLLGVYKL